jgi:Tol biopolymer transport system component
VLDDIDSSVSFSPDGKRFAFVRGDTDKNEADLFIANADGGNIRSIATSPGNVSIQGLIRPAWSPDGKVILFSSLGRTGGGKVSEVNSATGAMRTLYETKGAVGTTVWMPDGHSFLVALRAQRLSVSTGQLWVIAYPSGEATRLTNDLTNYSLQWLGMSRDASSFVSVDSTYTTTAYVSHAPNFSEATPMPSSGPVFYVEPMGADKILIGMRSGEYFVANYDGSQQTPIFVGEHNIAFADPCITGNYIVYTATTDGQSNLWRMNQDGSNRVQLTRDGGVTLPFCSPDGKTVTYFLGSENGGRSLKIEDGTPLNLKLPQQSSPIVRFSPDGKLMFYIASDPRDPSQPVRLAVAPAGGGPVVSSHALLPGTYTTTIGAWSPDGQSIDYPVTRGGVANVWRQPINGGEPKQFTNFTSLDMAALDWSPDGKTLFTVRGSRNDDIILLQTQKPQ